MSRISTLVLDTADLSSGDINTDKTEFVFRNIDFDRLLGDEWREYDMFNMMLVETVVDQTTHRPTTRVADVLLQGPPFAEVDIRSTKIKAEVSICTLDCTNVNKTPSINSYNGGHVWTLKRDDENLFNFRFRLKEPTSDATATGIETGTNGSTSGAAFPRQKYVFKIYKI